MERVIVVRSRLEFKFCHPIGDHVMEPTICTNVQNDSAMHFSFELFMQGNGVIKMYGISIQQLMEL